MKVKLALRFLFVFILVFSSCSKREYDPSVVGHWTLDGNADDESIYLSHGEIFGNPKPVAGAIEGKALDFNGDDFIEIGLDGKSPEHLKSLTLGSISLWFKARSWDVKGTMMPILYYGKKDGCEEAYDATNGGMIIEVGHGGIFPSENVFFTQYDKECEYPTFCFDSGDSDGIITPDQWYHFVAVVGEDFNTGYLNGKEITTRRYNFSNAKENLFFDDYVAHEKMWIGKGYWKNELKYFNGLIDDIKIYNKPLSQEQVEELYNEKL